LEQVGGARVERERTVELRAHHGAIAVQRHRNAERIGQRRIIGHQDLSAFLARVVRDRVVVVTWDPSSVAFWLTDEYFPEIVAIDRRIFPTMEELRQTLGRVEVQRLPIPHDCSDGFLGAYWRRPRAYLDAGVRSAISTFTKLRDSEPGLVRLRKDIEDGTWERRYGHILNEGELDLGYRIAIASVERA